MTKSSSSLETSALTNVTLELIFCKSAQTCSPSSTFTSDNTTLAPELTKLVAIAFPIPDAVPVTTATLLVMFRINN